MPVHGSRPIVTLRYPQAQQARPVGSAEEGTFLPSGTTVPQTPDMIVAAQAYQQALMQQELLKLDREKWELEKSMREAEVAVANDPAVIAARKQTELSISEEAKAKALKASAAAEVEASPETIATKKKLVSSELEESQARTAHSKAAADAMLRGAAIEENKVKLEREKFEEEKDIVLRQERYQAAMDIHNHGSASYIGQTAIERLNRLGEKDPISKAFAVIATTKEWQQTFSSEAPPTTVAFGRIMGVMDNLHQSGEIDRTTYINGLNGVVEMVLRTSGEELKAAMKMDEEAQNAAMLIKDEKEREAALKKISKESKLKEVLDRIADVRDAYKKALGIGKTNGQASRKPIPIDPKDREVGEVYLYKGKNYKWVGNGWELVETKKGKQKSAGKILADATTLRGMIN